MIQRKKKKELLKAKEKSPSITIEGKERSSKCMLEWLNTGSVRKRQGLVSPQNPLPPHSRGMCAFL